MNGKCKTRWTTTTTEKYNRKLFISIQIVCGIGCRWEDNTWIATIPTRFLSFLSRRFFLLLLQDAIECRHAAWLMHTRWSNCKQMQFILFLFVAFLRFAKLRQSQWMTFSHAWCGQIFKQIFYLKINFSFEFLFCARNKRKDNRMSLSFICYLIFCAWNFTFEIHKLKRTQRTLWLINGEILFRWQKFIALTLIKTNSQNLDQTEMELSWKCLMAWRSHTANRINGMTANPSRTLCAFSRRLVPILGRIISSHTEQD